MVKEKRPMVVYLKETKLQVVDDCVIRLLWSSEPVGYSYRPSVGTFSGILCFWDVSEVEVWSTLSLEQILVI